MLKTLQTPLFIAWVKNVYSLCVDSVDACVYSYTGTHPNVNSRNKVVVQPQVYTRFTTSFTPLLFTAIFHHLPDTKYRLSPLSTAPIIKTTKLN